MTSRHRLIAAYGGWPIDYVRGFGEDGRGGEFRVRKLSHAGFRFSRQGYVR